MTYFCHQPPAAVSINVHPSAEHVSNAVCTPAVASRRCKRNHQTWPRGISWQNNCPLCGPDTVWRYL